MRAQRTYDTHLFDRVNYLLETAKQHEVTWKEMVERLKREPWDCPLGWIRSHYIEGLEDDWQNVPGEKRLPH